MGGFRVAVGLDRTGWHDRFVEALSGRTLGGLAIEPVSVDMDASGWDEALASCSALLWKPPAMGPEASGFMKERIYFAEKHLGLVVVPGFETVWHFESKMAQEALLRHAGLPTVPTFASYDLGDALEAASGAELPVVFKRSHGAASRHVRLVRSRRELARLVRNQFWQSAWERVRAAHGAPAAAVLSLGSGWFTRKALGKLLDRRQEGHAYWQRFVPGNTSDLRVNVIGDMYGLGFWRGNRPGDFRASGGGRLDFDTPVPEEAVRMCMDASIRLGLDTMAYDILFEGGSMMVVEMSYGYLDTAVRSVRTIFRRGRDGVLGREEGDRWPQELWADWLVEKCRRERGL